jgi:hypothetical protein
MKASDPGKLDRIVSMRAEPPKPASKAIASRP